MDEQNDNEEDTIVNSDDTRLALPRDHSYLEESHPLLPDQVFGINGIDFKKNNNINDGTVELAVLELHGVVLFPGCTIPIKLHNRSLIRYIGRQIRLCRTDPNSQPQVRLGILTYEKEPHPLLSSQLSLRSSSSRSRRRQEEEQDSSSTQQQQRRRRSNDSNQQSTAREQHGQLRRGSWMRQQFSFGDGENSNHRIRQSITILRDEFEMSENEDNDYEDDYNVINNTENEHDKKNREDLHPLVGRVGTIAIVQNTHERTTIDNNNGDDQSSLWRRYEEVHELVFTAVGSNRFRILSCVNDDDCHIFKIEELRDEPLPRPPISTLSLPFRSRQLERQGRRRSQCSSDEECSSDDDGVDDDDDDGSKVDNSSIKTQSIQRQTETERMAWNLSQQTPVPYFVYMNWMPWSIVEKITILLNTNDGQSNLPSFGKHDAISNRKNKLEPTEFSYWMANNAPFSENERLKLLKMNSVLERLLFIWKAVKKLTDTNINGHSFIVCNICDTPFTTVSDVFTVDGAEGITSTYVNHSGFIHQITTLRNVDTKKITFQGLPCTENSYFPSYSWLITCCRRCGSLLGWKFQKVLELDDSKNSAKNRLDRDTPERPSTFYGFMASNVKVRTNSTSR